MANGLALIASAKRTVELERDAVGALLARIEQTFIDACELILQNKGRVVVTGVGKSGHIARKIAATLASTGTPAFFVHPSEASHGDLGMITRHDLVLALSNSGNTNEINNLLPMLKRLGVPLVAMTSKPTSTLAKAADVHIDVGVHQEACPLNLAPTSSTTVMLVAGDALAVALLETRGFTEEDFAFSHPGGMLGRRLLLHTGDIMHGGDRIPRVHPDTSLINALSEMSSKGFGMTTVVDDHNSLIGLFTDGDLRRALDAQIDVHKTRIGEVMTQDPVTITRETLAAEALNIMEQRKITALIVAEHRIPIGVLHMHDLLRAGIA